MQEKKGNGRYIEGEELVSRRLKLNLQITRHNPYLLSLTPPSCKRKTHYFILLTITVLTSQLKYIHIPSYLKLITPCYSEGRCYLGGKKPFEI